MMMDALQFLLRHGYAVVFGFVFIEQLGAPIPALPILLAAGALAGSGRLSLTLALGVALAAALPADFLWYQLGRRRGHKILNFLCRISLEPDSCVRNTENLYARHGARSLIFSKFVPGLSTAAPPLAGLFGMRPLRFLAFDAGGTLVWAGALVGLGYLFSDQIERVAGYAAQLGSWLVVILVGGLGAYIGWKFYERQKFLRELRIARITPEELRQRMDSGESVVVVDLRHSLEFDAEAVRVPGALHMLPDELDRRHEEIPRDREVVLYCT